MQNEFEKNMQQNMEKLRLDPADAVWEKIEAGLPAEKKPRRWLIFILLFAGLTISSLVLWNYSNTNETITENKTLVKETSAPATAGKNSVIEEPVTEETAMVKEDKLINATVEENNKNVKPVNSSFKNKNIKDAVNDNAKNDIITNRRRHVKTNGSSKINIQSAEPVADENETIVKEIKVAEQDDKTALVVKSETGIGAKDPLVEEAGKTRIDSIELIKKETTVETAANKTPIKKNASNWQYGIVLGAGISNTKTGLSNNDVVLSSPIGSGIPPDSSFLSTGYAGQHPDAGLAFNGGIYLQKEINSRWKFYTGLNYLYQSNSLKVGSKVDSVANFNFNNSILSADSYYGTAGSTQYKNKFHFIELPVLFQWKLSGKSPFYVEAGPSFGYLISSNALVKANQSGAYFTDADIFNKLLININAGAGMQLAQKTKFPFSIGYQFKYGVGSVIKTDYDKQHVWSSQLFLKIPLKN